MWLLMLACQPTPGGKTDASSIDSGDTGDTAVPPPTGALDACAREGRLLTEAWVGEILPSGSPIARMAWRRDVLVTINDDGILTPVDLPLDAIGAAVRPSLYPFDKWNDLWLGDDGVMVAVGDISIATHDLAANTGAQELWSVYTWPMVSVTATANGAATAFGSEVGRFDLALGNQRSMSTGLGEARIVADSGGGSWVAGLTDEQPAVAFDPAGGEESYGAAVPVAGVFGPPSGLLPLRDGGVLVAGGPEGYGWLARFDGNGVQVAQTQFESPGLPRLVGSPGSALGWAFFEGMGVFATDPEALDYRFAVESTDVRELALDAEGDALYTAHDDGMVHRWACAD
jgi:hypothetical protein